MLQATPCDGTNKPWYSYERMQGPAGAIFLACICGILSVMHGDNHEALACSPHLHISTRQLLNCSCKIAAGGELSVHQACELCRRWRCGTQLRLMQI